MRTQNHWYLLVAVLVTAFALIAGCGDTIDPVEDPGTDASVDGTTCPNGAKADGSCVEPDTGEDTGTDPGTDPDEVEEEDPVDPDPCAEYDWLFEFEGAAYECGGMLCTLEVYETETGDCEVLCDPVLWQTAPDLDPTSPMDGEFDFTDAYGTWTCVPD